MITHLKTINNMNLTTIKKFSIAVCLLLFAFFSGFAQTNAVVPNWNFSCTDDSYVEIVGTGTQTPGAPPSILNISNIATCR